MKNIVLSVLILLNVTPLFSQKWQFGSSDTPFDGKSRYAYVIGSGHEFPYTKPQLSMNLFDSDPNILSIYVSDAGYSGCDNKTIDIRFLEEDRVWNTVAYGSNDGDRWIFHITYFTDSITGVIGVWDLLTKMQKYSKLYLRLSSDCKTYDYVFPLTGSTSAINHVAKDYMARTRVIMDGLIKKRAAEGKAVGTF